MGKIKINLTSGNSVEKNVLSAFKSNDISYVIMDGEKTDSTGLPVIMVSKIQGNNISSIIDDNEWALVKDALRNLINGNQVEYISAPVELSGEDVFYKQLTLPVAYFDTLKNNYQEPASAAVEPQANLNPTDVVAEIQPQVSEPANVEPTPALDPASVMPTFDTPAPMETPVDVSQQAPIEEQVQDIAMPTMPDMNAMAQEPVAPANNDTVDFTQEKEAFMKACENMFDALVTKFNK